MIEGDPFCALFGAVQVFCSMDNITILMILVLLAAGCVSGLIAGLFGVGGGLVMVPVLVFSFGVLGYGPVSMHMAVATSLAVIVPTSLRSSLSHNRRGAVDVRLLRVWAFWVVAGAVSGSFAASSVSGVVLQLVFAAVTMLVWPLFVFGTPSWRLCDHVPTGAVGIVIAFLIGGLSAVMGIGGGLFGVTVMVLCSVPMHRAVGTASVLGFLIGVPSVLGYIVGGWEAFGRPPLSAGYISLPGLFVLSAMSLLFAPVGAALAHRLDATVLRRFFGGFVVLNGVVMLVRASGVTV